MATSQTGVTLTAEEISLLASEHPYVAGVVFAARASDQKVNISQLARDWRAKDRDVEAAAFRCLLWGLVPVDAFSPTAVVPF